MNNSIKLFLGALLQVSLVAMNVSCISKRYWIGMLISSWMLSFLWCYNVGRISISNTHNKVIYATGAMIGTVLGVYIVAFFEKFL